MEQGPYCWICGNYVEEAEDKFEQPQLLNLQYDPASKVLVQKIQVSMVFCPICGDLEIFKHLKRAKPKPNTKPKRTKKPPVSDQGDQIKE